MRSGSVLNAAFPILLALLVASPALAAERVVDGKAKACSDKGTGTEKRPWCRLAAAGTRARPGDRVLIRGVYRERLVIRVSGTKAAPIVYEGTPDGKTALDGTGLKLDEEGMIDIEKRDHITLRRLTIKHSPWYAMNVSGCRGVVIEKCGVLRSLHGGIVVDEGSSDIQLTGNDVRGVNAKGPDTAIHEAITISNVRRFVVAGNHVHHAPKEGIDAKDGSSDGEIRDNVVEHLGKVGIYLNHATRVKVFGNKIHGNGYSGIQLAVGDYAMGPRVTAQNDIYRNLIWSNGYNGVQFWQEKAGELRDNRLYNNVLYGNKHWGVLLEGTSGNTIKNNIIAKNGHAGIGGDAAARSTITHNLFFANRGDETRGKNAVTRDPQLANPARADFSLKPTSPAIDAGARVGLPFKGKAPDIGAFERR